MSTIDIDHTHRFTDRADYYAAFRPAYPDAVLGCLYRDAGLNPQAVVVDVGSGTGLSSELFLRHGHAVIGVEPNAAMRHAAERALRHYPNFQSIAGKAELIPLADACAGAAVSASAFHWFSAVEARAEFRRILKPQGVAILMGNARSKDASPFMRAYDNVIRTYSEITPAHQNRDERVRAFLASSTGISSRTVEYLELLDLREFLGRTLSYSATPLAGQDGHHDMVRDLERIFTAAAERGRILYHGQVTLQWSRLG